MSADNGVYILATRKSIISTDLEYRVAYAQAIDNIYGPFHDDDLYHDPNPQMIQEVFGDAPIFKTEEEAVTKAIEIHDDVGYTEYGIGVIYAFEDRTFNQLIKE